uniref:Uncharacterized protein n=1 Tax=Globodera rostochiensis TaxID=31243 RepID=A0A914H9G4_GLORO
MFGEGDSSSSESECAGYGAMRRKPKFRPRIDWTSSLSRADFHERFRLYPRQCEELLNLIGEQISPVAMTNHALNSKQRLLVCLRFLATNSAYFSVGDAEHVSKPTVTAVWKRELGQSSPNEYAHSKQNELMKRYYKIKGKNPKIRDEDNAKNLKIGRVTLYRWKKQFKLEQLDPNSVDGHSVEENAAANVQEID